MIVQSICWIIKGFPIRYNLGDYLNFIVSHDELHLDQAMRVLEAYRQWLENGLYLGAALDLRMVN